jgi:photosystem II stability/assembly factor-like uncharacterized protein
MENGDIMAAGFIQSNGVYISTDNGSTWSKNSSYLAFSGMCDMGNGVYLNGTYNVGTTPVDIDLYRSTDYGANWTKVFTASINSTPSYFRSIVKVDENIAIAFASSSETTQTDRQAKWYLTKDNGLTWTDMGNPYTNQYGGMNAIYDSFLLETANFPNGRIFAAAQPDSNILESYPS